MPETAGAVSLVRPPLAMVPVYSATSSITAVTRAVVVGAVRSTLTWRAALDVPWLPARSTMRALTPKLPSPCAAMVAAETSTVATPPPISVPVMVCVSVAPRHSSSSRSPASAPVPPSPMRTSVPSAASAALMPPPLLSGTCGTTGAPGATRSTSTVRAASALVAPLDDR